MGLLALAEHYDAEIMVGTFAYNTNAYASHPAKRGTEPSGKEGMWYDPAVVEYINDHRVELADGLVWCGEMNIPPHR